MKRISRQPSESSQTKVPRQTPVSCKTCRSKKLRCDRAMPCANCTSRGIECEYVGRSGQQQQQRADPSAADNASGSADQDELRSRLENLERLLSNMTGQRHDRPIPAQQVQLNALRIKPQSQTPESHAPEGADEETSDEIEARLQELAQTILTSFVPFNTYSQSKDFLTIHVLPMKGMGALSGAATGLKAYIPTYQEANMLLEDYITNIEYIHRLVSIPHARTGLQAMYNALAAGTLVAPARIAMFLSIFANSAARSSLIASESNPAEADEFKRLALLWQRLALDILDRLIRTRSALMSLEQLQATLILSHPCNYLEDLSMGFRQLMLTALNIAREMRLHRIDSPAAIHARRNASVEELVETEIKRRLWWHIVSTDWLISTVTGPQEHIYNILPSHFEVDMPLNCDDSQLPFLLSSPTIAAPSRMLPSEMSYQLPRIEMALICREVIDALPHDDADIDRLTGRLQELIAATPPFLRLDAASYSLSRAAHAQRPYLLVQARVFMAGAHFRIMEIHRPRLLHRSKAFQLKDVARREIAKSRGICLEAARAVVSSGRGVSEVWLLGAFVHHYFMAALVLAMDFHAGSEEELQDYARPDAQRAQHAEVQAACDLMRRMKRESGAVDRLVRPLVDVLKRSTERGSPRSRNAAAVASVAGIEGVAMPESFPGELDPFSDFLAMTGSGFDDEGLSMFLKDLDAGDVF